MWFGKQAYCSHFTGIWVIPASTLDNQQMDALMDFQTAKEKRRSRAQATASKDSSWPPGHMYQVLLFSSASGWPFKGFWSGNNFFFFFSSPVNKEEDSQTECFWGIFLPALFLNTNSMLINMEITLGFWPCSLWYNFFCWLFLNLAQHETFSLPSHLVLENMALEQEENKISRYYQIWGVFAETSQNILVSYRLIWSGFAGVLLLSEPRFCSGY